MMSGYHVPIEEKTLANNNFRQVLFTGPNLQLVLMTLQPNEDIGLEVHEDHDQFFRFEAGEGEVVIGEETFRVKDGDTTIVPAGAEHNVTNTSSEEPLKFYTIYAPPEHPDGTVHPTKANAQAAEA
jgi:mannose-6-phosphate isomerase-like protein (cupin superfamily)